ncbi:MAG: MCP four helix bundle domain-containing protein, partial [Bacteroidales bacterium]|nr:MCP four helix bundle domain-containing protein [Bacteroidales bacterium]
MKLKDLKIGTQLKIGFGIMMLLVFVLGFISYQQTNRIAQQTEMMYNNPLQVRRAVGAVKFNITAIHREMKDLFLPQNDIRMPATINNIELYKSAVFEQIDILYKWYLGPRSDIDTLKQNFITWNSLREETIRLLREGKTTEAALRTYSEDWIAGMQVEVLYRSLEKIDVFAESKSEELHITSLKLNKSLNTQLFILFAAFLILLLLLSNYLLRAVKLPIKELSNVARRYEEGDMNTRSSNTSKNEFGILASSFNSMVDKIQANIEINNKVADLTGKMLSEDDAKKFFQSTLQMVIDHTGSQMAAVYLLSEDKKHYEHFESIGTDDEAKKSFSAVGREGEFGTAITTQKIQHLNNIPKSTRFLYNTVKGKFIPKEIVTIPILSGDDVIAIISLASVGNYDQNSIQLIEKIHATYNTRIEGILAFRKIREFSEMLSEQNRELEAQKMELSSQSTELTEQNRELEIQKNQLSEANRLKTSFLSNMSHELRTPLNSVIALSGVLNRRLADQIPEEEYSYLEVIERNGRNLLNMINDILDIARIESGREDIEIAEFRVCDCIDDVSGMIRPQAEEKKIALNPASGDCEIKIAGDVDKVKHILQNLIGNAVKFTHKGSVDISVKKRDDVVEICVADTGIGIDSNQLPHIFNEFRQVESGNSRHYEGTGLGLAIAKKYARLLGGDIQVQSEVGQGSNFTLTLPLVCDAENKITTEDDKPGPDQAIAEKPIKPASDKSNELPHRRATGYQTKNMISPQGAGNEPLSANWRIQTILLVEDSEPAVIQIQDFLQSSGYKTLIARYGSEALQIVSHTIPDAIILDLMMPGIDGFEVLRNLRNKERTAYIPVLILTAKQ